MQLIKPNLSFDDCFEQLNHALDSSIAINHLKKTSKIMNILDKIVREKTNHLKYLSQKKYQIKKEKPSFLRSIKNEIKNGNNALITEFKRFSPSVSKFKETKFLQHVISDYDKSNTCCISILTDKNFGGRFK